MINIDEYALIIEGERGIRGKINTALFFLKEFFNDKLTIANVFISNWQDGANYIPDTSLWVFTESLMIKCLNYKELDSGGALNFEIYPLYKILYANILYNSMKSVTIEIHYLAKYCNLRR